MYLCQAAYFSRPNALCEAEVRNLVDRARANNGKKRITGALAYDGTHFIQVLEGQRTVLSDLIVQIMRDSRHQGIVLLGFRTVDERAFSSWEMAFIGQEAIHDYVIGRFTADGNLDPTVMTYESVVGMMRSLCE